MNIVTHVKQTAALQKRANILEILQNAGANTAEWLQANPEAAGAILGGVGGGVAGMLTSKKKLGGLAGLGIGAALGGAAGYGLKQLGAVDFVKGMLNSKKAPDNDAPLIPPEPVEPEGGFNWQKTSAVKILKGFNKLAAQEDDKEKQEWEDPHGSVIGQAGKGAGVGAILGGLGGAALGYAGGGNVESALKGGATGAALGGFGGGAIGGGIGAGRSVAGEAGAVMGGLTGAGTAIALPVAVAAVLARLKFDEHKAKIAEVIATKMAEAKSQMPK